MKGKTALETKLQEKEQLIGALTQRLEQAAEQLDRIHRSGGDRGLRHAGLPPELVEQHRTLIEDLQRVVQQWEDMQAAELLGRIESQISELRDLVSGQAARAQASPAPHPDSIAGFMSRAKTPGGPAHRHEGDAAPAPSGSHTYERLKAGLLEADTPEPEIPVDGPVIAGDDVEEPAAVDPPVPVDFDTADAAALRQEVERRDEYIAYLIRKLRFSESRKGLSGDWKALEGVPDELRARLIDYERRLDEALRQAEVELSLERARLGREAARVRLLEHQVTTERKRYEIVADGESRPRPNVRAEADDDPKSSRWLRMLGLGRGEEGED
jgi:hypothetical protein